MNGYKVLLVNPLHLGGLRFIREGRCAQTSKIWRTIWPPFSLASIGAVLEKEGAIVKICDCPAENLGLESFLSLIKRFEPRLVIMNSATPSIESDLAVCSLIKQNFSQTKIGMFGIHVTIFPEECFKKCEELDFIIRGEPEFTVKDLVASLNREGSLNVIEGLSWRQSGKVIHNKGREFIDNLNELPVPAWHLLDISKYRLPLLRKPYLIISPARGCGHKCSFCNAQLYYGAKRRNRPVVNVIEEIKICLKQFQVEDFLFWTENFTSDREYLEELLSEIIKSRVRIRWVCNSRVDNIDFERLKKMKKAGCWMISFGVESGNQCILDNVNKGITLGQIKKAFTETEKAGIETVSNCMFGLPGETKQTINITNKFVKELSPTFAQFYCAVPRPGSEFYNLAKANNWINQNSWDGFLQEKSVLNINGLRDIEIMKLRRKALIEFYLRPVAILKILRFFLKSFKK